MENIYNFFNSLVSNVIDNQVDKFSNHGFLSNIQNKILLLKDDKTQRQYARIIIEELLIQEEYFTNDFLSKVDNIEWNLIYTRDKTEIDKIENMYNGDLKLIDLSEFASKYIDLDTQGYFLSAINPKTNEQVDDAFLYVIEVLSFRNRIIDIFKRCDIDLFEIAFNYKILTEGWLFASYYDTSVIQERHSTGQIRNIKMSEWNKPNINLNQLVMLAQRLNSKKIFNKELTNTNFAIALSLLTGFSKNTLRQRLSDIGEDNCSTEQVTYIQDLLSDIILDLEKSKQNG